MYEVMRIRADMDSEFSDIGEKRFRIKRKHFLYILLALRTISYVIGLSIIPAITVVYREIALFYFFLKI
jgi:hypothetical protein